MSGRKSRTKGRAFEQELVRWFKSHGIAAKRGFQSRSGGKEQADVILPEYPGWHIEAKRPARCSVYKYLEQAVADISTPGQSPLVLLRADRKPTLAIMLADKWIEGL